ncbi:DUF4760 domain-containing protein [Aeromonas veronii]|uniref:DUF4760 domain-containing protein n=1 Tax=Aeromonas veronii TaxID=654 RepID=UPI0013186D6B|nr:DUF4760 domain-containing protein [Aeromonas veronii]QHC08069.1 DUF4760 domain-containing protein [Aeromonas veronii]
MLSPALIDFFIKNPTVVPVTLGLVVAVVGVLAQRRTAREVNALKFQSDRNQNKEYERHNTIAIAFVKTATPEKIAGLAGNESESEEAAALMYVLNEWERCANAIHYKVYDEKFLYVSSASGFLAIVRRLRPYIDQVRTLEGKSTIYDGLLKLDKKWRVRKETDLMFERLGVKRDRRYYTICILQALTPFYFIVFEWLRR